MKTTLKARERLECWARNSGGQLSMVNMSLSVKALNAILDDLADLDDREVLEARGVSATEHEELTARVNNLSARVTSLEAKGESK